MNGPTDREAIKALSLSSKLHCLSLGLMNTNQYQG